MLYYLLKFLMRLALPVFYKRVHLYGLENIPASGPVILACNHPNSFLDAIIIGTYSPRPLNFLTRSDVFNAPWKRWLLGKMHMVPIYRMRDGIENLEKNQETFDKCREVLSRGGVILIFSEGLCIQEMKLRPLKKGAARIALDYSQSGSPLWIVAVGLNYPHPMQIRKRVFVGFAPAFNAADFSKDLRDNPAKAINAFNKKLEEQLRSQVIQIAERKDEPAVQTLIDVWHNNQNPTLSQLISGTTKLDQALKADAATYDAAITYQKNLRVKAIDDAVVAGRFRPSLLSFLLGGLLALPCALLCYLPFSTARNITQNKVRLVEFKDSVMVAGGMVLSFFFSLILVSIAGTVFNWQVALATLVAMIALSAVGPWAYDQVTGYLSLAKNSNDIKEMQTQRKKLEAWLAANLSRDSNP